MKKIILSAILGLATLISCEKKHEENATHESHKTEQAASGEHATHDDHEKADDHDESVRLELNNGEKWAVNPEMKPYIAESENLLNAYDKEKGDYQKLAAALTNNNNKLVKSCTMNGKSHDVLHAWLLPHMQHIDHLKKSANREEANETVHELKESMDEYHKYFN
ncbi:hypothetical protein [Kaistella palustris]|uniref:hypothetical protein n=1 Tax=Kaistella palustris TaxID=493376 RepID=UPI0004000AA4|nr:hypothetical protein [Kaistella palustris]